MEFSHVCVLNHKNQPNLVYYISKGPKIERLKILILPFL